MSDLSRKIAEALLDTRNHDDYDAEQLHINRFVLDEKTWLNDGPISVDDLADLIERDGEINLLETQAALGREALRERVKILADKHVAMAERDGLAKRLDAVMDERETTVGDLRKHLATAQHAAFDLQQRIEAAVAFCVSLGATREPGEGAVDPTAPFRSIYRILRGEDTEAPGGEE